MRRGPLAGGISEPTPVRARGHGEELRLQGCHDSSPTWSLDVASLVVRRRDAFGFGIAAYYETFVQGVRLQTRSAWHDAFAALPTVGTVRMQDVEVCCGQALVRAQAAELQPDGLLLFGVTVKKDGQTLMAARANWNDRTRALIVPGYCARRVGNRERIDRGASIAL